MSSEYVFYGVNSTMKKRIVEILNYAKEIRNSRFAISGNNKFDIISLEVRKNQDIFMIDGVIKCLGVERTIEAYVINDKNYKLYLDVKEDDKLLSRTNETFIVDDEKVIVTTEDVLTDEVYHEEIFFDEEKDYEQLGILLNA